MTRRVSIFVAIAALAIGLAACGSSSKSTGPAASDSGTAQITIDSASPDGFAFHTTPVKAGSTVTVKNETQTEHTVTADDGGFDVTIDGGKTATFTAPAAGAYKFHCNIHSFMHGTLTVT
jgi:plastocyanin